MATKWLILANFCSFILVSTAQSLSSEFEKSSPDCEEVCQNTYPQHTYDTPSHLACCLRGCRLFTIIDFVEEFSDINTTRESCAVSCQDAYSTVGERDACVLGCNQQAPFFTSRFPQMEQVLPPMASDVFYPLMYVHSMYSNMVDKLTQSMSVRWSFYIGGDNGKLVVVKSTAPRFIEVNISPDEEYKTSNYLETNLAELDNSATPNLRSSQLHVFERDLGDSAELSAAVQGDEEQPADFLGCISRKMGLPRLLLSLTIFLSALVMIWLCISSTVTAPTQHVRTSDKPQKLSIYGDLEYLRETGEKDRAWLLSLHPQEAGEQAGPLPIKIKVGVV